MRNRTLWMFALLALVITVPTLAEEPAVPEVNADQPELILPGVNTSCDPVSSEAPEAASDSLEMVLDGTQGAQNMAECWIEDRVTYTCSCFGNTRFRKNNQSRTCCTNGWCSGWSTYSSSCTNYAC